MEVAGGTIMKREERKAASAIKKGLNQIIKPLIKSYGFKMAKGRIWTTQDDLLFVMIPLINLNEKATLHTAFSAKPLYVDDYFWDILGFVENKKAPVSLRATGAFSVQSVCFYSNDNVLCTFDIAETEMYLKKELECFSEHIQSVSSDGLSWFYKMEAARDRYWQCDIMRLMILLHNNRIDEVLEYASQHELRDFIVNGKSFTELLKEYLTKTT